MRIKGKLTAAFLALTIIPMLFVGYILIYTAKENLKEQILHTLEIIAGHKAEEIEAFVSARKSDLIVLQRRSISADNFPILDQFSDDRSNPSYVEAKRVVDSQLAIFLNAYQYLDIMLVNMQGKVIYVFNPDHEDELNKPIIDEKNLFRKAKTSVYIGGVQKISDKKHPYTFYIAAPAYGSAGEALGFVYAEVDMGFVYKMMHDNAGFEESGDVFLVQKTPDDKVLFLSPLKYDPEATLRKSVLLGGKESIPAQKAALGEAGSGVGMDYRGQKVLSAWRPIPSLGWGLVAKVDTQEAFSPIENIKRIAAILFIITISLIVLAVSRMAKSIAGPIQNLHHGTEIIGNGNLDYKVGIDTKDEVGQLSRAFDSMTEKLRQTTTSVESLRKEIAEREKAEDEVRKKDKQLHDMSSRLPGIIFQFYARRDGSMGLYYVSNQAKRLLGLDPEPEGFLERFTAAILPEQRDEFVQSVRKTVSEVSEWKYEGALRKPSGEIVWISCRSTPSKKDDEILYDGVVLDITERKHVEEVAAQTGRRLQLILASSGEGICGLDLEGKHIFVNPQMLKMLGYEEGELLGRESHPMWHHSHADGSAYPSNECPIYAPLYDGRPRSGQEYLWRKDSSGFPVEFSSHPILEDERVIGTVLSFRDTTERKRAQDALRESEKRFMDVLHASSDAILLISEDKFVNCNEATARMLGYVNREEFLMTHPSQLSPPTQPDGRSSFEKANEMMRLAYDQGFHRFEWVHRKADGEDFPVQVSLTPVVMQGKTVLHCVWIDLTRQKQDEQLLLGYQRHLKDQADELAASLKESHKSHEILSSMLEDNNQIREELGKSLEGLKEARGLLVHAEKMEAVGRMASGVAHEVKNPLAIILQGINYFEGVLPSEEKDHGKMLQMMKDNVKRADKIVRGLLDFSRAQEPNMVLQDINAIIESSLELVRHRLKLNSVEWVRELGKDLPQALLDRGKIEQAFVNLFNNAVDAMPAGGKLYARSYLSVLKAPENKVGNRKGDIFRLGEEVMVVEVEDTGAGIDEDILKKVFDPFFTTKNRAEGTGLGLSIVKSIIEMHDGLINMESKKGKGTKFIITFKIP